MEYIVYRYFVYVDDSFSKNIYIWSIYYTSIAQKIRIIKATGAVGIIKSLY